jgi:hypothetical protein
VDFFALFRAVRPALFFADFLVLRLAAFLALFLAAFLALFFAGFLAVFLAAFLVLFLAAGRAGCFAAAGVLFLAGREGAERAPLPLPAGVDPYDGVGGGGGAGGSGVMGESSIQPPLCQLDSMNSSSAIVWVLP